VIELVGFDGDDTLWHSEGYYQGVHAEFERVLGKYLDLADARVHERLLAMERDNLHLFGYGAKGMTLSMLETAISLTGARIAASDLHHLLQLGKQILRHPVELLDGIRDAVAEVARDCRVVLITKGDLFHQEAKVAASGLGELFHRIEIVSEKDERAYQRVLAEFGVDASRFLMVGNSLRSDIEPVLALGGWGLHMPYHVTWAHEAQHGVDPGHPRLLRVDAPAQIPGALRQLQARASGGEALTLPG
jgi:putative hydrolase of the HAD superfamily